MRLRPQPPSKRGSSSTTTTSRQHDTAPHARARTPSAIQPRRLEGVGAVDTAGQQRRHYQHRGVRQRKKIVMHTQQTATTRPGPAATLTVAQCSARADDNGKSRVPQTGSSARHRLVHLVLPLATRRLREQGRPAPDLAEGTAVEPAAQPYPSLATCLASHAPGIGSSTTHAFVVPSHTSLRV